MAGMIRTLSDANCHDAGIYEKDPNWNKRLVIDKDGKRCIDKLPPMLWEKYVNKAGHVIRYTMSNAPALKNTNTPYAHSKRERLEGNECVPYGQCPFFTRAGLRWMPEDMRKRGDQCDTNDFGAGAKYGDHCACAHVEEIIARRQKKHALAESIYQERRKTHQQQQFELDQARNKAILEMLATKPELIAQAQAQQAQDALLAAQQVAQPASAPTLHVPVERHTYAVPDKGTPGDDGVEDPYAEIVTFGPDDDA